MRQDRWETARGPADFWSAFRRGARPATGPCFRASGRGRCLNRHVCPDESVPALAIIIENLARAKGELLRAADVVPARQWKTRPAEGRWSAGELVGHLSAIERAILSRSDRLLQEPAKSVPFFKRFHVPMMIVEARVIRRKAAHSAGATDGW
ncbi:MAG: hypothetical protein DMG48_04290 [Acidobacteria bacterium]|nr:MAG: hypothetical protein DMG48_04290 [Acidobacteriota bacterium]